jgi:DNA-binding GntR family transcriptional regulator
MAPRKKELIYSELKKKILGMKIRPHEVLKEEEVAARFGVSRTPAREALQLLEKEGFLAQLKKVGYVVRPLTRNDLKEIIEVRSVLEGYAAHLATLRRDPKTIARLRKINQKARRYLADNDLQRFFKNSSEFHDVIYQSSGNTRLCALIESLRDNFLRYRRMLLRIPKMPEVQIRDHEEMLDAMESGNGQRVEKMVREHIILGGEILLQHIEEELVVE